MTLKLLLAALGLPTLGLAQPSFTPHAYLGVGASVLSENPFREVRYQYNYYYGPRYAESTTVGPVLTVGWQFSPRLALQLSPAVQWSGETGHFASYQPISGQVPASSVDTRTSLTHLSVPLLMRFTFTRPAARLRVDGLLGAAWLHSADSYTYIETQDSDGAVLKRQEYSSANNTALLTLGPAVRYGLGPRLELGLALPVHYDLGEASPRYELARFGDYLWFQPQLSATYALGN